MTVACDPTCVVGLAWGDEGKGKIVDLMSEDFDIVVRYNGGANAGHTICIGDEKFAVHLLPTGVLRANVFGVIGPGVVVDPVGLIEEIDSLSARSIEVESRLKISDRAHLVMPYHKIIDRLSESCSGSQGKIGTTARGIGPCYAEKMFRSSAVRMVDLLNLPLHKERIRAVVEAKSVHLKALYGDDEGLSFDDVWVFLQQAAERLTPMITDTSTWLVDQSDAGKSVFFEGANGMLLDIDHGTYPYVTSSNTGPQGVSAGAGVPTLFVKRFIGVTKAYSTRVGSGPFPTELNDEVGDLIRNKGNEFGTTTGRPRRCGWLDAVAIRASVRLGGVTEIAMTHLDTLSGFDQVGLCVGYRIGDETLTGNLPASADQLDKAEPVFEMLPGWKGDLQSVRCYKDLPAEAKAYISRLENFVKAPVSIVGVGPERTQTIVRVKLEHELGL